jgi:hypothetical protein
MGNGRAAKKLFDNKPDMRRKTGILMLEYLEKDISAREHQELETEGLRETEMC